LNEVVLNQFDANQRETQVAEGMSCTGPTPEYAEPEYVLVLNVLNAFHKASDSASPALIIFMLYNGYDSIR